MSARRALAASLLVPLLAACGGIQRETHPVQLHIETDPAGAWVSRVDDKGKQNIGQAPLDTEVTRWSERMDAGVGMWITSGVLGALTGGLGALALTSDDTVTTGVGGGLALSAGICFLIALPLAIIYQANDGEVINQGYLGTAPTFEATMAGYSSASVVLSPFEEPPTAPLHLRLAPSGEGAVLATLDDDAGKAQVFGPSGGGGLGLRGVGGLVGKELPAPQQRPVMAVFALEDRSKGLASPAVEQLTDYIAARLTEAGRFRVVPRSELRARLSEKKAESYGACVDESCQIQLGKAVAAQKSLATRLIRAGGKCAMTMTLYDLVTEASETAVTVRTACSEQALMDGIDQLTTRLVP